MRRKTDDHRDEFCDRAWEIETSLSWNEILTAIATILHFALLVIYKECFT